MLALPKDDRFHPLQMNSLSNLFIVGAPKCGTSSLFDQINLHSQIIGTSPKETFALLSADHPLSLARKYNGLDELQKIRNLGSSEENTSILLEGTTHNLYSKEAIAAVASLGNQARVIVLLRNPVKRILSSFQYTQSNLARIPSSFTFSEYVDLLIEGKRTSIQKIIKHPVSGAVLSMDLTYSDYEGFIQNWFDGVGREKVRVILAEEYFHDPSMVSREIFDWLGLSDSNVDQQSFERRNETRKIASPVIHRIAYSLNRLFPGAGALKPLKKIYFHIQNRLSGKSDEDISKPMEKLNQYFEPRIKQLSELLDRDLSLWSQN